MIILTFLRLRLFKIVVKHVSVANLLLVELVLGYPSATRHILIIIAWLLQTWIGMCSTSVLLIVDDIEVAAFLVFDCDVDITMSDFGRVLGRVIIRRGLLLLGVLLAASLSMVTAIEVHAVGTLVTAILIVVWGNLLSFVEVDGNVFVARARCSSRFVTCSGGCVYISRVLLLVKEASATLILTKVVLVGGILGRTVSLRAGRCRRMMI